MGMAKRKMKRQVARPEGRLIRAADTGLEFLRPIRVRLERP